MTGAHTHCDCKRESRPPGVLLHLLFFQREKVGETCPVKTREVDSHEIEKHLLKKAKKKERMETEERRYQKETLRKNSETSVGIDFCFEQDENNNDEDYVPRTDDFEEWTMEDVIEFFEEKLGKASTFVFQYLPEMKRKTKKNEMTIPNTARASLRCSVSPRATAMICSEFLKDLIVAGHVSEDKSYLACDRMKVERARKLAMIESERKISNITGIGYDGKKDKNTRAMITDLNGNRKLGKITEEHVSISIEPHI